MGNCSTCLKKTCCCQDDVQNASTLQQPSREQQPGRSEDDVQSAGTLQQPSKSGEQQPGRCEDDVQSANTLQQPSPSGEQQLTIEECIQLFNEGKDKWDIDALINGINDLLNATLHSQQKEPEKPSTSATSSTSKLSMFLPLIQSGGTFLKFVNEHIVKEDMVKTATKDNVLGAEGTKILSDILQQLGNIHWIIGGLSILGYLLSKFGKVSENKAECLALLKSMVELVDHIRKLNIHMPEEEKRLRDALLLIVEGCIMCASQIRSGKFFRFVKTSVNSEMLKGLHSKIDNLYRDLTLTGVIGIHQQLPVTLPLAQPIYPALAVGLEEPVKQITEMLELRKAKARAQALVIYGFGGIGKTTLANAVLANLKLESYRYTKIILNEDPQKNDLKSMQQQLLKDVFPEYQDGRKITLRDCEEGRHHLTRALQSQSNKRVFIYIDNALREKDLLELLSEDLGGLSQSSRILVTARDLSVTDLFEERGMSRRTYRVKTLADEHGEKILCNDPDKLEQIKDVKKVLHICGGIPLALKIVGAQLRKQNYRVDNCSEILRSLEEGEEIKKDQLSERLVNFVYNRLETSTKEAFLDICTVLYIEDTSRRSIEHIVGVSEVATLEEAALITAVPYSFDVIRKGGVYWEGEEELIVHDVILAKGRRMGNGTRTVEDAQSLRRAVEDQKVLQSIKGVRFPSADESEYMLEESQLSCMSNSLRVLGLGDRMSVAGRSSNTFQELRLLCIGGDIPCLPVRLEALPRLASYVGPIFKEGFSINKLPKSLKYLEALAQSNRDEYATSEESNPIQTVQNSSLQELRLTELKNMPILLKGIHQFTELKILGVGGWDEMEELPAQVCQLRSLKKLLMYAWKSLKRLPEFFSNLTGLTHIGLGFCPRLEGLCSSFGELRGLRYLDLRGCEKLTELPYSFGHLIALEYLDLSWCTSVTILPDNFGQLTALKYLNLSYCIELKGLPSNFVQLTNLEVLEWFGREELPLSLEELRSLEILG